MAYANIRTKSIQFEPIPASAAPTNSIYVASETNNTFSTKTAAGASETATAVPFDSFVKRALNTSGSTIPANTPVSRKSDGSIGVAVSDFAEGQRLIGVTLEAILNGTYGSIGLVGRNVPSALSSFGFSPGQDLYVSQSGSYTSDPASFTGDDDSIILIGIADNADNSTGTSAPDLILLRQILVRP